MDPGAEASLLDACSLQGGFILGLPSKMSTSSTSSCLLPTWAEIIPFTAAELTSISPELVWASGMEKNIPLEVLISCHSFKKSSDF